MAVLWKKLVFLNILLLASEISTSFPVVHLLFKHKEVFLTLSLTIALDLVVSPKPLIFLFVGCKWGFVGYLLSLVWFWCFGSGSEPAEPLVSRKGTFLRITNGSLVKAKHQGYVSEPIRLDFRVRYYQDKPETCTSTCDSHKFLFRMNLVVW